MTRTRTLLTIVAATVMTAACGDLRGPLTSGTPSQSEPIMAVPNPEGRDFIVFGEAGLGRASKASVSGTLLSQVESVIVKRSRKERLKVKFDSYESPLRVHEAKFEIEKNSIGDAEPLWKDHYAIVMQVETGQSLADVRVKFQPSGMSFTPVAKLTVKVKGSLDPTKLVAYHVSGNGLVTKPRMKAKEEKKGTWKLEVEVPGFSEYTYDDDDRYSDEENPES